MINELDHLGDAFYLIKSNKSNQMLNREADHPARWSDDIARAAPGCSGSLPQDRNTWRNEEKAFTYSTVGIGGWIDR